MSSLFAGPNAITPWIEKAVVERLRGRLPPLPSAAASADDPAADAGNNYETGKKLVQVIHYHENDDDDNISNRQGDIGGQGGTSSGSSSCGCCVTLSDGQTSISAYLTAQARDALWADGFAVGCTVRLSPGWTITTHRRARQRQAQVNHHHQGVTAAAAARKNDESVTSPPPPPSPHATSASSSCYADEPPHHICMFIKSGSSSSTATIPGSGGMTIIGMRGCATVGNPTDIHACVQVRRVLTGLDGKAVEERLAAAEATVLAAAAPSFLLANGNNNNNNENGNAGPATSDAPGTAATNTTAAAPSSSLSTPQQPQQSSEPRKRPFLGNVAAYLGFGGDAAAQRQEQQQQRAATVLMQQATSTDDVQDLFGRVLAVAAQARQAQARQLQESQEAHEHQALYMSQESTNNNNDNIMEEEDDSDDDDDEDDAAPTEHRHHPFGISAMLEPLVESDPDQDRAARSTPDNENTTAAAAEKENLPKRASLLQGSDDKEPTEEETTAVSNPDESSRAARMELPTTAGSPDDVLETQAPQEEGPSTQMDALVEAAERVTPIEQDNNLETQEQQPMMEPETVVEDALVEQAQRVPPVEDENAATNFVLTQASEPADNDDVDAPIPESQEFFTQCMDPPEDGDDIVMASAEKAAHVLAAEQQQPQECPPDQTPGEAAVESRKEPEAPEPVPGEEGQEPQSSAEGVNQPAVESRNNNEPEENDLVDLFTQPVAREEEENDNANQREPEALSELFTQPLADDAAVKSPLRHSQDNEPVTPRPRASVVVKRTGSSQDLNLSATLGPLPRKRKQHIWRNAKNAYIDVLLRECCGKLPKSPRGESSEQSWAGNCLRALLEKKE